MNIRDRITNSKLQIAEEAASLSEMSMKANASPTWVFVSKEFVLVGSSEAVAVETEEKIDIKA